MRKDAPPKEFVLTIMYRSSCSIRVGALVVDKKGRWPSWGWNHSGPKCEGVHAEIHAVSRTSPKRLRGATIYVAGERYRRGTGPVPSKPCPECEAVLRAVGIAKVVYRGRDGDWYTYLLKNKP